MKRGGGGFSHAEGGGTKRFGVVFTWFKPYCRGGRRKTFWGSFYAV